MCASPCQIAALCAFLDQSPETPTDNLITVDYVCRGINSPKVWRKYLDSIAVRYGSKVVYCKTQCKEYGWRNLTQKTILENGKHIYDAKRQSDYVKSSKEHLLVSSWCRPSCYDCRFKGFPRTADITIADFWGIEKVCKGLDRDLGTSLVMVNSKKGEHFFDLAKPHMNQMQVPLEKAVAENRPIHSPLEPPALDRSAFFADLERLPYSALVQKYDPAPEPKEFIPWLKKVTRYPRRVVRITRLNPVAVFQFFRYNTLAEILRGDVIIFGPHCIVKIARTAVINKKGITVFGAREGFTYDWKPYRLSRLAVYANATLNLGPNIQISGTSDIRVEPSRTVTFKGYSGFNLGLQIKSGADVEIGEGVMAGWDVSIRAANSHWVNRAGYKVSAPVVIGDHVWLCEGCVITQGVKVGDGAIVGARAIVTRNVPAHSMVAGNPAGVVDEDVLWKP